MPFSFFDECIHEAFCAFFPAILMSGGVLVRHLVRPCRCFRHARRYETCHDKRRFPSVSCSVSGRNGGRNRPYVRFPAGVGNGYSEWGIERPFLLSGKRFVGKRPGSRTGNDRSVAKSGVPARTDRVRPADLPCRSHRHPERGD